MFTSFHVIRRWVAQFEFRPNRAVCQRLDGFDLCLHVFRLSISALCFELPFSRNEVTHFRRLWDTEVTFNLYRRRYLTVAKYESFYILFRKHENIIKYCVLNFMSAHQLINDNFQSVLKINYWLAIGGNQPQTRCIISRRARECNELCLPIPTFYSLDASSAVVHFLSSDE